MDLLPTELHSDFEQARLTYLAELFANCREAALGTYRPAEGETPWDLGCRCYSRITFAIERAAGSGEQPWLSVLQGREPGQPFVFRIGTQPVKFYTGSSARPSARSLRIDPPELRALGLFGNADGSPAKAWVWRIAIGVDATGRVSQVTILQTTAGGSVRTPYSIPFSRNPNGVIIPLFQSGIELDEPEIEARDQDAEAGDAGNKK